MLGFYEILDAAANPTHPNHAEAKKWLDDYDPNLIDELPIKMPSAVSRTSATHLYGLYGLVRLTARGRSEPWAKA